MLEFRLLYQGQLLGASRSNTRADHKHHLRKEFHKQLKVLWKTKSPLKERRSRNLVELHVNREDPTAVGHASYEEYLAKTFTYHGFSFIPVVTGELFLSCSLDVLFLRPGDQRLVYENGDIDNKIKTVFDSLRMPKVAEAADLKARFPPEDNEMPLYCLLQDDSLISEVKVTADHLLRLPQQPRVSANETFLVVHVRVTPTRLAFTNLDFA